MSEKLSKWMRSIKQSGLSIGRHDMTECVVISIDAVDLIAALEAEVERLQALAGEASAVFGLTADREVEHMRMMEKLDAALAKEQSE